MRPDMNATRSGTRDRAPCRQIGPDRSDRNRLERVRHLLRSSRTEAACSLLDEILAAGSTGQRSEAALLKAWCLIDAKRHEEAAEWLAAAERNGLLDPAHREVAVVVLNLDLFRGRYEHVLESTTRLLAEHAGGADRVVAELHLLHGAALRWLGRLDEAREQVEFAASLFAVLDEPLRAAVAANFLGWTQLSLGRLDDARRSFEKSLELNDGLGAHRRVAQNYQNLGIVCYKQGDYEPAAELLQKELDLVDGLPDMTCRARLALGQVQRLRGDADDARASLLEAFSLARRHGMEREETLALEFLGDVLRDEDRPDAAREFYRRGMGIARRIAPRGDLVMELLRREGECLDREGRHADANRVLNEALRLAEEVGDRFEAAVIRRCLGLNAAHLRRWDQARGMLARALEELRQLTARHEAMIAAFHLASVCAQLAKDGGSARTRRGAVDEAWAHALQAQQFSQELGVPHLAERIEGLVADLARVRLQGDVERPLWRTFSSRRAPASRVVAVSPVMQRILRRCDGFARYDTPVLLLGEAGTGRRLLARRIHEHGPRGSRPLLEVDCRDRTSHELRTELFGGGSETRGHGVHDPGLVARAAGGTLVLVGVEALPRDLQGEVLRLVQDGVYRGADGGERRADVRLIAVSESALDDLADRGGFRPELYFRLRLMSAVIPPLRERPQDVIPLVEHFLAGLEGSGLGARTVFGADGVRRLSDHHWPQNVAEVEAVAHQAWLMRDQDRTVELVSDAGQLRFRERTGRADGGHVSGLTWESLSSVLDSVGGNKALAARNLGISRMTLYRWLKQLEPGPA